MIHKLTEDVQSDDEESRLKVKALQLYLQRYPKSVIIDPLPCVKNIVSRSQVCHILDKIISSTTMVPGDCFFTQPKYLIVDDVNSLVEKVELSCLEYPVICKPIEACGTPNSHSMVKLIITTPEII